MTLIDWSEDWVFKVNAYLGVALPIEYNLHCVFNWILRD